MRAVVIMFDSLSRHMLSPYGCDWVDTPNFERLAKMSVTFDNYYVGSMASMPVRRELHTGRYNFLHRSWGALEPFDDSMPEALKKHNVHAHLVSDVPYYWKDGSGYYHLRYSTCEFIRGQAGDPWKGYLGEIDIPESIKNTKDRRQDWINRKYMQEEEKQPLARIFKKGLEFIETNYHEDNWLLHIDAFDPHEPFFSNQSYKDKYSFKFDEAYLDWPPYKPLDENDPIENYRYQYAALVSMCDNYLGKFLDLMDNLDLWKDVMVIVHSCYGLLLGEHGWWGKSIMPFYNEIAHVPLFIWDPRYGRKNERCNSLVQTIDIAPTLLDYFKVPILADMQGKSLTDAIAHNKSVREAALFGVHSGHVNCIDGRYIYMRAPANIRNKPLYEYTLIPTKKSDGLLKDLDCLKDIEIAGPFSFTKGCKLMRIEGRHECIPYKFGNLLFDLEKDPEQENPIQDKEIEEMMLRHMIRLMKENDSPIEQFIRLGLPQNC